MVSRELKIAYAGDIRGVQKALGAIDQAHSSLGSKLTSMGTKLTSAGKTMTRSLTLPIVAFGALAVKEFGEAEKATASTEAVLKSTGGAANVTADHIGDLSERIGKLAAVDDEAVQAGANMLLTFTNIRNEAGKGNAIFDRSVLVMENLASKFGSEEAAAVKLGKALNDPIKGIMSLTRVGVQFTEQQRNQITRMVESGNLMGAQKVILAELNKEFGGQAKAQGDAATSTQRLALTMRDLAEKVGGILEPILAKLTGWVTKLTTWFDNLSPASQQLAVKIGAVAAAAGPVLIVVGKLMVTLPKLKAAMVALSSANGPVAAGMTATKGGALGAALGMGALAVALERAYVQLNQYREGNILGALQTALKSLGLATGQVVPAFATATTSSQGFGAAVDQLKGQLTAGTLTGEQFKQKLRDLAEASGGHLADNFDQVTDALIREAQKTRTTASVTRALSTAHTNAAAAAQKQKAAENLLAGGLIGAIQAQRDHAAALATLTSLRKKGKTGTEEYRRAELDVLTTEGNLRTARKEYISELKTSGLTQDQATRKFKAFGIAAGLSAGDIRRLNGELRTLVSLTAQINRTPVNVAGHYAGATGSTGGPHGQVPGYHPRIAGRVGGGGATVHVHVAGNVTSERNLVEAVRKGLVEVGRRNGGRTGL